MTRPDDDALAAAARVLNGAERVTILAGAGCAGAHNQLIALAEALQAPVVHPFRGKDSVEYDNLYDVGMTGLIGFSSGYRAMEHCDALVMLGTDFPYRQFCPQDVPVIQVDVQGERIGRRDNRSRSPWSVPSRTRSTCSCRWSPPRPTRRTWTG